jgi:plasmid stabilization system protein ParE
MLSVEFHPAASVELDAATGWYLERSATAATEFVRKIEHAIDRIAESLLRYPQTRLGRRRFVVLNFPYDLVYRVRENSVLLKVG